MSRRYTAKPHLDRLMMRRLGSALQPEYDLLVRSHLPQKQRDLVLEYSVAEAMSDLEDKSPRSKEVVPRFPT